MTTDQVERQTAEEPASPDAHRFVESLPVQTSDAKSVFDMIQRDSSDSENIVIRMMFAGLTWSVVAAALGAVAILTWNLLRGA